MLKHPKTFAISATDFEVVKKETPTEKELKEKTKNIITGVKAARGVTIDWIDKVNELKPEDRMNCTWNYVLLGESTFYGMSEKGATTQEILEYARRTKAMIKGTLGDYVGIKEY